MYPILLDWGPLVLPAWHTFYVLGAIAAFALMMRLGRRHGGASEVELARLYVACYVAGYFGARLLSIVIEEPESHTLGGVLSALVRFGPMTFYGGAIGSFIAGALYVRKRRLALGPLLDITIPAGLLALALGRVGCFLNGDDYGKAAALGADGRPPFWAVIFPNLQDGIARHPVQLYEAVTAGLLVVALVLGFSAMRRQFRPGVVGFFGIVVYANLRFGLEFLRDDFRGFPFGTWMSTSQFVSILVLAVCGLSLPFWLRKPSVAPAP